MRRLVILLVAVSLIAVAGIGAAEDGDPPDEANFGICTAEENAEDGDEASNGTVSSAPPFNSTSEEDCQDADQPGADDNPGDDHRPDDAGSQGDEDAGDNGDDGGDASDNGDDASGNQGPP